jgi:hypothetical protein
MIIISPRMRNGADGETRTLVGQYPAVYKTAAVATEPHRQNGGSPRNCTEFSPVKSRDFTVKVCNPNANAKVELNHRSQVCEALTGTGVRVAERIPSTLNPAPGHYFDRAGSLPAGRIHLGKWTGMRVTLSLFRFGRPTCVYQHLCPRNWNPVLESHEPLWFCSPPPELLGQRDVFILRRPAPG